VKSLVFAVLILLVIGVCAQLAAKPQLSVRVKSDKTSYRLHDKIQFEIIRENTGKAELFIYRRWEWGASSKLRVFDSNGSEMKNLLWATDDPPPLTSTDFILLNPGESFGTQLQKRASDFVKLPGEYEFVVEYSSYLSDELAGKHIKRTDVPFWSQRRGTVESNRIKLRITQ